MGAVECGHRGVLRLANFAFALICSVVAAAAQSADEWKLCATWDYSLLEQKIGACSALIDSANLDPAALGRAHGYRGLGLLNRYSFYREQGDKERAFADLERSVALDATSATGHRFHGLLRTFRGELDLAIAELNEAVRIDPNDAPNVNARGAAYARKQDIDLAIADFTEAIRLDPQYSLAYINRARAHYQKADFDRALADLDEAIRLTPKAFWAFYQRSLFWFYRQDYSRALADSDEALRLNPRYTAALGLRAMSYTAQTRPPAGGIASLPDALLVFVARGAAGACGENCSEWLAVEGLLFPEAPRRLIAALDRLGGRRLPVVINFRGGDLSAAMRIGKILRERGMDVIVGQTMVASCLDASDADCVTLKRAGGPLESLFAPIAVCGNDCLLGLAGGVRRTVPDSTSVKAGAWGPNSVDAAAQVRERRFGVQLTLYLKQVGVDPKLIEIMGANNGSTRTTDLSREELLQLHIVTSP